MRDIIEFLERITKAYGERIALKIREGDDYRRISYSELANRARDVSSRLIKLGVKIGDRVGILSENSPEWVIAFFGILSCGAIVVPLDIKLKERELSYIINDSGIGYLFASSRSADVIRSIKAKIILLNVDGIRHEGESRIRRVEGEDTAIIVYTSGTTGDPKGVELTYKNLFFEILSFESLFRYGPNDVFLSLLPLNHTFEITCGMLAPLYKGSCITYLGSLKPTEIITTMKETKTTIMCVVPLILEMFYKGIMGKMDKSPNTKRLFKVSLKISKLLVFWNIRRILFRRVHAELGGRLRFFISGGAPLNPKIAHDFQLMGIPILQGYGLTETSPVISANTLRKNRIGSVGRPLDGVEVKICDDGEIITRGPHVMKGYFGDPSKTKEVIRDGWFHTGDIGKIDKDGYLYIEGRLKNLIVSPSGKKIQPEEVEREISKSRLIKEVCVLGRKGRKGEEVYAVVVPDYEYISGTTKEVRRVIANEIKEYCKNLADYKRVVDFEIWKDELPKTSTRKIIRREILKRIAK